MDRILSQRRRKQLMWTLIVVFQILIIIVEYSALLFVDGNYVKKYHDFLCNPDGKSMFSPIAKFSSISDFAMCQD